MPVTPENPPRRTHPAAATTSRPWPPRRRPTPAFWAGRHAVVTGGSSGIGLALVNRLLDLGARVSAVALDDEHLDRLAHRTATTPRLTTRALDVTDPDATRATLTGLAERHGPCRSLFTCAGITEPGYFHHLSDDTFRSIMEVNYFGTLHAVRAVAPAMTAARHGTLTCVVSVAGILGVFGYGAYSPSKFAVRGLTEVLRQELRPVGVRVSAVYPPDVDTPMLARETPLKPPELRALSGTIQPLSAARVAESVLAGTQRGQPVIIPDWRTRGLRWVAGAAPGVANAIMDRIIAGAGGPGGGGSRTPTPAPDRQDGKARAAREHSHPRLSTPTSAGTHPGTSTPHPRRGGGTAGR
ncbi:SDR family oxidoreductase [Actinoalloteichus spitiensis]|uniref:SDR family oxidoreductase n=1 Tax=Actinoalloteichus spitiensis TaxID=252394 RepID=UPI00037C9B39|nr:SDR family oxidoreductase [Actinoalloteichus spitiensis]